jgi:hypothetical protein
MDSGYLANMAAYRYSPDNPGALAPLNRPYEETIPKSGENFCVAGDFSTALSHAEMIITSSLLNMIPLQQSFFPG